MVAIGKQGCEHVYQLVKNGFKPHNPYMWTKAGSNLTVFPMTGTKVHSGFVNGLKNKGILIGEGNLKMKGIESIEVIEKGAGEKIANLYTKGHVLHEENIPMKYLREAIQDCQRSLAKKGHI